MKTLAEIKLLEKGEDGLSFLERLVLKQSLGEDKREELIENLDLIDEESLWVLGFVFSLKNLLELKRLIIKARILNLDISLLYLAEEYMKLMHDSIGQKRKYTGENYWVHTKEVSEIVSSVGGSRDMRIAAMLHDLVEDVKTPISEVEELFGLEVSFLVEMLTDVSKPADGNRKVRKEIDLKHTALASSEAQTIKLADLISNSRSIEANDKDFAKVYMREKRNLLQVLKRGNPELLKVAEEIIDRYFKSQGKS